MVETTFLEPAISPESSVDRKNRSQLAVSVFLLVAVTGIAVATMRYATRSGVGITFDSSVYVDAARNLAAGRGYTEHLTDGSLGPVTHYPPMYSLTLAVGLKLFGNIDRAMAAMAMLMFAGNVGLVFCLVRTETRSNVAALLAAAICLMSQDLLRVHATAWSESLFFFLMLISLRMLAGACNGSTRMLVLAAIASAFCLLTRFAAISLVLSGATCLLVFGRMSIWNRIKQTSIYVAISVVPFVLLIIRNLRGSGTATDRSVEFVATPTEEWARGVLTIARWWWPRAATAPTGIVAASGVLIGLLLAAAVDWRAIRQFAIGLFVATQRPRVTFGLVLFWFIIVYLFFLIVSMNYVDHATPMDWRILSPILVCGIVMQVSQFWRWLGRSVLGRGVYAAALIVLIGLYWQVSVPWLRASSIGDDKGYNSPAWHEPRMLAAIQSQPADKRLCSNAPGAILFLCQRGANGLPKESGKSAFKLLGIGLDVRGVTRRLAAGGELVVFHVRADEHFDDTHLIQRFNLVPIVRLDVCSIYDYPGPGRKSAKAVVP